MNLQEALDQCLQMQWRGTAGETTAQINGQAALDFFGGASLLKSLNTRLLDRYVLHLAAKGNAPATINRKLAVLSKIFTYAFRRKELAELPHIPYRKEPVGRLRWLTVEEERRVVQALNGRGMTDHAQAVEFLVDTGLRPSELWRLTARDYSAGAILITQTKNKVTRLIPLTQRATFILERRLVRYPDGPLFPHDNAWMIYGWNIAKRALGLSEDKEFVVYALRHTCASRLVQRNVPLYTVQNWLGHKNALQTMRYAHLGLSNLEAARNVLEV